MLFLGQEAEYRGAYGEIIDLIGMINMMTF